jgi:Xaa-Pro aminopeptidase
MEEYAKRRATLASQLQNNSVVLLNSSQLVIRNGDAEFPFRQSSDFYYLTGFNEPEAIMVLSTDAQGKLSYVLFNRPHDSDAEIWNGKRAGQEGACTEFGANAAHDIAKIDSVMPELLADKHRIYYPLGENAEFDRKVLAWLQDAKKNLWSRKRNEQTVKFVPDALIDLLPLLHEMRLFKTDQEIDNMRKAAAISAAGHAQLMQQCRAGQFEYQLEAIFNANCLQNGCRGLAYNSIVAGGNNSCTLHYTENDQLLKDGELVLVDAGGEYNNYAADITRTFPVNGKFTAEQRQIYELVLNAQLAGIAQVKPGNLWDSVQNTMVQIIVKGLIELGILKGDVNKLIKEQAHRRFYMHGSGHWLGMDVHDVGQYKQNGDWRVFEPGMVLTVEPGIYIAKNSKDVAAKWWGIGVRIEDDVLVCKQGNEVLSQAAPKTIAEIESARI